MVAHILTGMPLWLALAGLGFAAAFGVVLVETSDPAALRRLGHLAARGVIVGAVGTAAYDGSRWLLVHVGGLASSPLAALPLFGQALLGSGSPNGAVAVAGRALAGRVLRSEV